MRAQYQITIIDNPGYDPEFPWPEYLFVVWIKDLAEPVNSFWEFCKDYSHASQRRREIEAKGLFNCS